MQASPDIIENPNTAVKKPASTKDRFVQSMRNGFQRLREWASKSYQNLSKKGFNYWLIVAFIIPTSMLIGDYVSENRMFIGIRYWCYHQLQNFTPRAPTYFNHTVVVAIGDEEYWRNETLARRVPLNKDYLAELVLRLADARAPVIALD